VKDFAVVGFSSPDPHTLVIQLEQPMPRFPDLVATGPWIPVHPATVAKFGREWTRPGNFVGNGPFTLTEWRPQQRIIVRRNPRYHRFNAIRLEDIQFLRFDSGDTEERAYRAGQVDVTMSIPAAKLTGYERGRPTEFHRTPLAETHYLSFNTTRTALKDPRVRRALALAIDRDTIVERVLQGGQLSATRMLPPVLRGPTDRGRLGPEFRHDPTEAARLLAAAGFPQGRGFPKLEVTAWSPSQSRVLEAIQEMWRRSLGIEVGLVVHEAKIHLDAMHAGNYDIGFATTLLDWPDGLALLSAFASDSPENFPNWRNAAFDRGLAAAQAHGDQPSRDRDTLAAEQVLLEDAPIAPVYFNARNWLMAPRVHGWQDDPLWTRFYHDVYLETK
jgi:oligopeptide transport system substrate-binding protein